MSSLNYLHGIDTIEINDAPQPITTAKSSVIGLVGTAGQGAVNSPVLILGSRRDAIAAFGPLSAKGENQGFTIPRALDQIFAFGGATVVVVNVLDPSVSGNQASATNDLVTLDSNGVGELDYEQILSSGFTIATSISAPALITAAGTAPVLPAGCTLVSLKDSSGTVIASGSYSTLTVGQKVTVTYTAALAKDTDYTLDAVNGRVTRVSGGKILPLATLSIGYSYVTAKNISATTVSGNSTNRTGAYALLNSLSTVFVQPRVVVAPGYSEIAGTTIAEKGPVAATLEIIANRLNGVAIIDCPGRVASNTATGAITFRNTFSNPRLYFHYPHYMVQPGYDIPDSLPQVSSLVVPASSSIAGLIGAMDNTEGEGFSSSPSNHQVQGIIGLALPVDSQLNDPNSTANYLNANNVATTIRWNGFSLHGNKSSDGSFLNKRRTADMVEESILYASRWAQDRGITRGLVETILLGVTEYLRRLTASQAILGGRAWADPDLNPQDAIAAGNLVIDYAFTGPTPLDNLTFRAHLVNDYVTSIFDTTTNTSAVLTV
jgi:phage tail sheath protein FI